MSEELEEQEEKEYPEDVIKELTKLPRVGKSVAQKLYDAGFRSYNAIAVAPPKTLAESVGISEQTASNIIQAAMKMVNMGFISADVIMERRKKLRRITTGSKNLDALLDGGIELGNITEVFGAFGSGKSQLAHQLSVNVQLPEERGGVNANAIYIDTERTFRPERIHQMAEALGLDPTKTLARIKVANAYNSDHQMLLVKQAEEVIQKEKVGLVVVDSLTGHFRAEYIGRGVLAERQAKLNKHLHDLMHLADTYDVAVFVTNQVMATPDMFFGDPTRAVGGHVLAHVPQTRIYLRKTKPPRRLARIVDSPYLEEGDAIFVVTAEGIRDPED